VTLLEDLVGLDGAPVTAEHFENAPLVDNPLVYFSKNCLTKKKILHNYSKILNFYE